MNHEEPTDVARQRQALSGLMDGDPGDTEQALQAWRGDVRGRADWHTYHLIGELMRSDDVHVDPERDAGFLAGVRERLDQEPVVLAPAAPGRPWNAWLRPAAVAAGFCVVAGVLVMTRVSAPGGGAEDRPATLASQGPAAAASSSAEGTLIRSAELDRYLSAHRQYSGTSALAAPGGLVRNAAATVPGR